jgi:cyclopropane fatty-acyl-phospholipid synthase-like methyltransferase
VSQTVDLKAHYRELYRRFGPSHQAVQWSSRETQERRFDILCDLIAPEDAVIDVGSGLGDLLGYLRRKKDFSGRYLGLDVVPEFVEHASQAHAADARASFAELDVTGQPLPGGYDVIVASGIFNNRLQDNWAFLIASIEKMFAVASKAVAFNALSTYVDYQDAGLYYCDPLRLFDHLKRHVASKVTLRHDYLVKAASIPFEFSMYLCK